MSKMTNLRKFQLSLLIIFLTLITGPIAWLIYDCTTNQFPGFAAGVLANRVVVSQVVAGFAFTMLGFLAALITILFAMTHSDAFRKYNQRGNLTVFFVQFYFTIGCLLLTSGLSIYNLSAQPMIWPFRIMLMGFVSNLAQIGLLVIQIAGLAYKATNSPEAAKVAE